MLGRRWLFGILGLVSVGAFAEAARSERLGLTKQRTAPYEWTKSTVPLPPLGLAWPGVAQKPAVDWDGTQYIVMWADGAIGTERVWAARLSKDLAPIDAPALNTDVYVPDPGGAGPVVNPSVTCRSTGTCLLSWSGGSGPATAAFQQARLWTTTSQAPGPVIVLPEIAWAERSSIAAGETGFLLVWMKHAVNPFDCSVESVFVANDGTTRSKTLAPATSSQCVAPRAIWNGTHYVVTRGAEGGTLVQSYDAELEPIGNVTLAMSSVTQLASDESGGVMVMGLVNQGLSFQKLSASLEPGVLEAGTVVCQRSALVRRAGGFSVYCMNDARQLFQYFRKDSNGAWTQSNPNLRPWSEGLAVTGGVGHGLLVAATPSLDAYRLTTTGTVSLPAVPAAVLDASATRPTLAASSSGWVVSWNQDTLTKLDGARYVRISPSGAALDSEPRLLYPGTSKVADSLALSSAAMMTQNHDGLVLFNGDTRTEAAWPVANSSKTWLIGGPDGFLQSFQTDTYAGQAITHRTFLVRRNAQGDVLDDPPIETCNAVSVGEGGQVCYGRKFYSSGQNYLVARELSTWLLVKPGVAPLTIDVPADHYGFQVFGNDGSFHLARGTIAAETAVISPDGELSAWGPVTLPPGAVSPSFHSFGAQDVVIYRTVTDGHKDGTWIAEMNGTIAGEPSPLLVEPDDESVFIASAIPGSFVRVHRRAGKPVVEYFKQTVATGGACLVSTQCGDGACVDGTCQVGPGPGEGGTGNLGGADADAGAGNDTAAGAGGMSQVGGSSAAGGDAGGSVKDVSGGAEAVGGDMGAPPGGNPDPSGCQCRAVSRSPGSGGWWLSASLIALAVQRRARRRRDAS